jgi:hypothetical protein
MNDLCDTDFAVHRKRQIFSASYYILCKTSISTEDIVKLVTGIHCILILYAAVIPKKAEANPHPQDCEKGPCEKYDRIIDDPDIRESFLELWVDSETDLPINQRSEQGGWIVSKDKNEFEVIPFPSDWSTSACDIEAPNNFLDEIPPNLVGVVHTHPFFEGEDTTVPDVCGEDGSKNYQSGANKSDLYFLIQIANHLSDFCIKSYIIDGNNVISMNTFWRMNFYLADSFFQPVSS